MKFNHIHILLPKLHLSLYPRQCCGKSGAGSHTVGQRICVGERCHSPHTKRGNGGEGNTQPAQTAQEDGADGSAAQG